MIEGAAAPFFLLVNLKAVFVGHVKDKNKLYMKWLTLPDIKKQLRVDFDDEDDVLELYGSSAEDTVLNYLNRTYQDLLENYGEVPAPIRQATLMLVDKTSSIVIFDLFFLSIL